MLHLFAKLERLKAEAVANAEAEQRQSDYELKKQIKLLKADDQPAKLQAITSNVNGSGATWIVSLDQEILFDIINMLPANNHENSRIAARPFLSADRASHEGQAHRAYQREGIRRTRVLDTRVLCVLSVS